MTSSPPPSPEPPGERYGPEVPRAPRIEDIRTYRPSFVGMAGLACMPFLIWGAVGLYGVLASVLLTLWWLFLLSLGIAWFMHRPRRLPWLAVLAAVVWLATVVVARG